MIRETQTALPITARRMSGALRWRRVVVRVVLYVLALAGSALFAAPFVFAFFTSLKVPSEIYAFPPKWIPANMQWSNYWTAWTMVPFGRFVLNTTIITFTAMAGQIGSATIVAYGFARFRFPGKNTLFLLLLGTFIMPVEVTIIPQFIVFKQINWVNTWLPLIVPNYFGGGAFSIFLLRQFFMTLPRELDDAAKIDGATSLGVLWRILIPLAVPALLTVAIFAFVFHWNDFFFPLIYLSALEKYTVSLGLRYFQQIPTGGGGVLAQFLMAASMTVAIPVVVLFLVLQRYFIRGIVMSGIKG